MNTKYSKRQVEAAAVEVHFGSQNHFCLLFADMLIIEKVLSINQLAHSTTVYLDLFAFFCQSGDENDKLVLVDERGIVWETQRKTENAKAPALIQQKLKEYKTIDESR